MFMQMFMHMFTHMFTHMFILMFIDIFIKMFMLTQPFKNNHLNRWHWPQHKLFPIARLNLILNDIDLALCALLHFQSGRVVRALVEPSKYYVGPVFESTCGTSRSRLEDIVKLDAVQLYNYQRSNKAVGVLVLWVTCQNTVWNHCMIAVKR